MKNTTDPSLAAQIRQGNEHAFKQLYQLMAPRLFVLCQKFDLSREQAQEVIQDTFLKVWEKRSGLQENISPEGYVFMIARNFMLKQIRQKAQEMVFQREMAVNQPIASNPTELHVIYQDLRQKADQFISGLPEKRRQVFLLHREQGLTCQEIAERLGISVRTAETHLYQANKSIGSYLEGAIQVSAAVIVLAEAIRF